MPRRGHAKLSQTSICCNHLNLNLDRSEVGQPSTGGGPLFIHRPRKEFSPIFYRRFRYIAKKAPEGYASSPLQLPNPCSFVHLG